MANERIKYALKKAVNRQPFLIFHLNNDYLTSSVATNSATNLLIASRRL